MLNKMQGVLRRPGSSGVWQRISTVSTGGPGKPRRERLSWDEICADFHGRWVALAECRYDQNGKAVEAVLVDTDDELADLCERVQDSDRRCDILRVS